MRRLTVVMLVLAMAVPGAALAGNLKCHVTRGGVDVPAVAVTLEPGGASANTNAGGTCIFPGLSAGTYRASVSQTVAGTLYGAIGQAVVPAAGTTTLELRMTEAVRISQYTPLRIGSKWQYRVTRVDPSGTTHDTRREQVPGTDTLPSGDVASVIVVSFAGSGETFKQLFSSNLDGFTLYGESRGADMMTYDPPMRLGDLCPLGYQWTLESTVKHSDGTPDQAAKMTFRLVRLETVTVPAGTFTGCPHFTFTMSVGAEKQTGHIWMARNVGFLRMIEIKPDKRNDRVLEEYSIPSLLLRPLPLLRPLTPAPLPRP